MVTWLEPKLVCEVAYQVLTGDLRLRMARFKRLRPTNHQNNAQLTK